MQKGFKERLGELSALGAQEELRLPHIELHSNRSATVEGCAGIIEYDRDTVRLNCRGITVKFTGQNLCLGNLSGGCVRVSGDLLSLDFGS